MIPAATVAGIGGGGKDDGSESGAGSGFGLAARPSGAWMVEEGEVTWKPAVDVNRIVLGGQIIALGAILVAGRILVTHSGRHASSPRFAPQLAGLVRLLLRVRKSIS